jgi:riboflavin kinase / FMN adenylyltransferase
VVPGNRLGTEIGFPTANIRPDHTDKLVPGDGVYAIRCSLEGREYTGMLNIGIKPTLSGQPRTIEAHLFDLNLNLYEKKITITFEQRIRDEQRFGSLEDLKKQLVLDKAIAMTMLGQ